VALRVRAVVPTLWRSPVLVECLEALRREEGLTPGVEVSLVVVAQGEAPAEDVEPRVRAAVSSGAGGELVQLGKPVGFSRATNVGIAAGEGTVDHVATVNDDAVVQVGWLKALVEALEAEPGAAAAQGWNFREDGRLDGVGIAWNRWLQAIQIGDGKKPEDVRLSRQVWGVSATAALYRKTALDGLDLGHGVFDERLESYYEDVDLAARLRAADWTALSVREAEAIHQGSSTGGGTYGTYHTYLNRHLVRAKNFGIWRYHLQKSLLYLRDGLDRRQHAEPETIDRAWRDLPGKLDELRR
jgi:GT2 family glycosyltransferase